MPARPSAPAVLVAAIALLLVLLVVVARSAGAHRAGADAADAVSSMPAAPGAPTPQPGPRGSVFTRLEQELSPGGFTLEAAAVQVPLPDGGSRALVPASLGLRARLPHPAGFALRLRPGTGCVGPAVCIDLALAPPATAAR